MKNKGEELIKNLNLNAEFAVGNDLVYLENFKESFNPLFKEKAYTEAEIDYCEQFDQSILRYASTWAAKEAVYKALKQITDDALGPKKIEISRTKIAGKPTVNLPEEYNSLTLSLTISHDGDYIWAIAVLKKST